MGRHPHTRSTFNDRFTQAFRRAEACLTTAADRADRMVLPLPANLRARGSAQQRVLTSLLKAGLIEELVVADDALCWRQGPEGKHQALRVTDIGMAAVDKPLSAASQTVGAPSASTALVPSAAVSTEAAPEQKPPATATATPSGKLGNVVAAISTEAGATLAELVALTGWLPHTTRAAITGLRKRGYAVSLEARDGRKAYRATQAA